jgi:phospholipase C
VFIVWDDWGGWYDHVTPFHPAANVYPNMSGPAPNPSDPNEWGFRVPVIVVSPYVKSAYVSHTSRSQSSIVKFMEWNFGTAGLHGDDTYVDNFNDVFDFNQSPTPYGTPIPVGSYQPMSPWPRLYLYAVSIARERRISSWGTKITNHDKADF